MSRSIGLRREVKSELPIDKTMPDDSSIGLRREVKSERRRLAARRIRSSIGLRREVKSELTADIDATLALFYRTPPGSEVRTLRTVSCLHLMFYRTPPGSEVRTGRDC